MEKLATNILSRLSGAYPSFIQLEECRREICVDAAEFKRGVAYLEEKAFAEIRDLSAGECDGVYGEIRITAAGLDYLSRQSRRVKATFFK